MGELIALAGARSTSQSRSSRELAKLLSNAHAYLDSRPTRYVDRRHVDRKGVLAFEVFQRTPLRTSMFGHQL